MTDDAKTTKNTLEEKKTPRWSLTKFDSIVIVGIMGLMVYTLLTAENSTAVTELWGFFKRSGIMALIGFTTVGIVIPTLLRLIGDKEGAMFSDYVDNVRRPANGIVFVVWLCILVFYSFVIWEPNVKLTEPPFTPAAIDRTYKLRSKEDITAIIESSVESKRIKSASVTLENDAAMLNAMNMFKNASAEVRSVTK